jgi:hypothetical protein
MPDWLVYTLAAVGLAVGYIASRGAQTRVKSRVGLAAIALFCVMGFIAARISDRTGIFCSNTGSGLSTCRQTNP